MTYDELAEAIEWFQEYEVPHMDRARSPKRMLILDAAHAHLRTLPRTRKVKRWVVTYEGSWGDSTVQGVFRSLSDAERTVVELPYARDPQFHEIEIEETVAPEAKS